MEEEETMDRVKAEEASTSGNEVEKVDEEPEIRLAKRAKVSGESEVAADFDANMKRVAEIVIILAGIGRMRGGRSPSDVERELMEEARRKLACLCESLPPRELLSKNAYGVLVEDLGLNKLNDQKVLSRPRPSIAEKLRLTMKKMEEAKEFAAKSSSSQTPHNGVFTNINGQSMTDTSFKVTPDKLNSMTPSLTGFRPFTPASHRSVSASASHNHVQANEPLVTASGQLETDSSQQIKSEIRYGGMSHSAQSLRATSAGDQVLGAFPGSSSAHFSSVSRDKVSQGLKQTIYGSRMDQGIHKDVTSLSTSQLPEVKDSRVLHQASGGPYSVHQTVQHASLVGTARASHNEIVRDIQKFLQSGSHGHPEWSPPSVAYMDAPLTCQICKVVITDIGSLLVCDACEKGVHVRCLHAYNQKSIPQGEWTCPKCLISNQGKPLPLKYGRVGKLVDVPKLSNLNSLQCFVENKIETSDKKSNQQKITADGCATEPSKDMLVNSVLAVKGSISEDVTSHGMMLSTGVSSRQVSSGLVEIGEDRVKIDLNPFSTSEPEKQGDNIRQTEGGKPIMNDEKIPRKIPTSEDPQPLEQSDTRVLDVFKPSNQGQMAEVSHEGICVKASASPLLENGNIVPAGLDGSSSSCNSSKHDNCGVVSQDDHNISRPISGTIQKEKNVVDCAKFPEERFPSASWVDDQLQVVDGKSYYQACCVNKVVYKLKDHAFFHSEDPNGAPYIAKLEVLWEDNTNGTKWARVSMCYSHSNLPHVGQPCTPEENEGAFDSFGSHIQPLICLKDPQHHRTYHLKSTDFRSSKGLKSMDFRSEGRGPISPMDLSSVGDTRGGKSPVTALRFCAPPSALILQHLVSLGHHRVCELEMR